MKASYFRISHYAQRAQVNHISFMYVRRKRDDGAYRTRGERERRANDISSRAPNDVYKYASCKSPAFLFFSISLALPRSAHYDTAPLERESSTKSDACAAFLLAVMPTREPERASFQAASVLMLLWERARTESSGGRDSRWLCSLVSRCIWYRSDK